VSVTLRVDGREAELVVADDGPGINPADRSRVFDRFTRLDDARGRDEGGSGLGLPIAREIIEAHGGRITIGDGPGGRLVVHLPLVPSGARIGRQGENEAHAGGGGLGGDVTPMGEGDVPHDGQREPRAGLPGV
jgi:hypothetical protein